MNIKPLFDRVVIKQNIDDNVTPSGIVIPQTSQERPQTGKVVAIGDGVDLDNNNVGMKVAIGDNVVYTKYAGTEFKIDNTTYLILRQIDIIGIIEN